MGLLFPHLFPKVFLAPSHRVVAYSSTLLYITVLVELKNNINIRLMNKFFIPILLICNFLVSGCLDDDAPKDIVEEISMVISSETGIMYPPFFEEGAECMLAMPEDSRGEWIHLGFNEIKGFTYERGHEYELLVIRTILANPPMDSSGKTYTLKSILYDRLVASTRGEDAEYRVRYADLIEMNKMSATLILTSQGTSFFVAGEELARSKDGDHNSYASPVEVNEIDWNLAVSNADLVSYYRGLIDIRKNFAPFSDGTGNYSSSYKFATSLSSVESYISYVVTNDTEGQWEKVGEGFLGADLTVTGTFTSFSPVVVMVVDASEVSAAGVKAPKTGEF